MMDKLNWKALSGAFALTWAIFVFLTGLSAALFNFGNAWVGLLSNVYIGYEATVPRSFIGIPWALLDGAIAGALVGLFYNYLNKQALLAKEE